jgi:NADH-quinone oxidoreductase subunit M
LISITGKTDIFLITEALSLMRLPEMTEKLLWLALFISLAVKVPMFPFHTWLPDAHVEAPTAGSVILAGILIKIGGFGMIRFLLPMLPNASIYFADFVIWLSIAAVLYGSFIAIKQEDIKKMIAYSSVAHMGFVTAAIFSLNKNGLSAAIFQMFSHGLVSGALFLSIGVLYERLHTREFKNFGGIASKMPNFAMLLMVFTMASAGLPGTSGFVGEFLTIIATYKISIYYAGLIALSVIFGALYMLYMYKNTMFGVATNPEVAGLKDLSITELFSLGTLSILIIIFGVYPTVIFKFIPA